MQFNHTYIYRRANYCQLNRSFKLTIKFNVKHILIKEEIWDFRGLSSIVFLTNISLYISVIYKFLENYALIFVSLKNILTFAASN
jgi:hypothetical protein